MVKLLLNLCLSLTIVLSWANFAHAFAYHDNDVYFRISGSNFKLEGGSFKVKDFSVSNGEDPDKHIYKGLKVIFDSSGKMTFKVGRNKTQEVAKWFANQVPSHQTTFYHEPTELNFAMTGTLELTLSGDTLSPFKQTYSLENVVIAQGSAWPRNNWWFGSKSCEHNTTNTVKCKFESDTGSAAYIEILRGGNSVNEYDLKSIIVPPFRFAYLQDSYAGESTKCVWQNNNPADAGACPPFVIYLNQTQADTLKLTVKDGKLYNSVGQLFDTSGADSGYFPHEAIFVMDSTGTIYASNQHKKYMFHHSSILAGRPVTSAGEMVVSKGIISAVTFCSGHYRPDRLSIGNQILESLSRQGYEYNVRIHHEAC